MTKLGPYEVHPFAAEFPLIEDDVTALSAIGGPGCGWTLAEVTPSTPGGF